MLSQVALEGDAADLGDDLAEGGESVVGVCPSHARLRADAQSAAVVLGERRHRAARPHAFSGVGPQQVGGGAQLAEARGVGQRVPQGRGRKPSRSGASR